MLATRDRNGYATDLLSALGEHIGQWRKQIEDKETGQHVIDDGMCVMKGLCGVQRQSKVRI